MTLRPLTRLRQEVGGADGIAQAHVHGGLIVEHVGCQERRAGIDESVMALAQLIEGALEGGTLSHIVTDPDSDRGELLHNLRWCIMLER
jgi:hypothetical protein